jgi:hypothetical protein
MILAITLVSACTPKPTPTPPQAGVVEVRAMDAPQTGVSSIVVTTSNIEVHKAGASLERGASEDNWITVVSQEKTFDSVAIQSAEVFLGQKELEAGLYTQIRLDVTNVKVVLEGKELIAKLPGEKLKVVSPWEIKPGQKTILTLDFDADKFVVITGKDQAQVKPVIKLEVSQGERPLKKPTPDTTAPTVSSTIPSNAATGVSINSAITAIFSEALDPLTVTTVTFILEQGLTPVSGTVTYAGVTATFTPAVNLAPNTDLPPKVVPTTELELRAF